MIWPSAKPFLSVSLYREDMRDNVKSSKNCMGPVSSKVIRRIFVVKVRISITLHQSY